MKWTGRIVEIDGEVFTAELTSAEGRSVYADFSIDQLGRERDVVKGDIVYVTVRVVRGRSGYPSTTSAIRLRRLGNWTAEELERLEALAVSRAQSMEGLVE